MTHNKVRANLLTSNKVALVREKGYEITFDWSNKYLYQPAQPFRLQGLLVWEGAGNITSLMIGNEEQLVEGCDIPLEYYKAPFTIDHARAAIAQNALHYCLPDHFKGLRFPTCNQQCGTVITVQGLFTQIMCWGVELNEN